MTERLPKDWPAKLEAERPVVDAMVIQLRDYGAQVQRHMEQDVGALNYEVQFADGEAQTTLFISLRDHQTDSDLVITHMTTLPDNEKGKGRGTRAIQKLLEWAKANNMKTVRAVQVSDPRSRTFWERNGFAAVSKSVTGDYLLEL